MVMVMVMVAIVPVAMVSIAAMLVMIATATIVVIVPIAMVATTAMVAILLAPKDLRGIHSAALEISTRAGLVQTYIEYHSSIRTGHGKDEASRHSYYDRSDFHDCTPKRERVSSRAEFDRRVRFCQRSVKSLRNTAIRSLCQTERLAATLYIGEPAAGAGAQRPPSFLRIGDLG